MRPILKIIAFLIVMVYAFSCQEPYYPESLDKGQKILVLEGSLQNNAGPHKVALYYARPFQTDEYEFITGAILYVLEDDAKKHYFEEDGKGNYVLPKGKLMPKTESKYSIHIQTPEGDIFESRAQQMPDTLGIEGVIAKKEKREFVTRAADGDVLVLQREGIAHYLIVDNEVDDKSYFRVESSLYIDYYYYWRDIIDTVEVESPLFPGGKDSMVVVFTDIVDCRIGYGDTELPRLGIIDGEAGQTESERTALSRFVPFGENSLDPRYRVSAEYLSHKLYHISQEAFSFYSSVHDQLNAPSRLFDPIPTQLLGNLLCTTDPSKTILGFWEVSAVNIRQPEELFEEKSCIDITYIDTIRM